MDKIDINLLKKVLKELKLGTSKRRINRVIILLPSRHLITSEDEKSGLDDDTLDNIKLRLGALDGTVKEFARKIHKVVMQMPI